jgi:hypothetical protein
MSDGPSVHFWNNVPRQSIIELVRGGFWNLLGSADRRRSAMPRRLQAAAGATEQLPADCQVADSNIDADAIADFLHFLTDHYNTNNKSNAPISTLNAKQVADLHLRPILLRLPAVAHPASRPLAGCISSQPAGRICRSATSSAFPIRLITNFCVHPNFRKQGIGSRLLTAVWSDTNQLGEDATIFLKEGAPLLSAGLPLFSGRWVYRFCSTTTSQQPTQIRQIVDADVAEHLLIDYSQTVSDPFKNKCVYNSYIGAARRPSQTLLYEYKGLRGSILTAFTPAFQDHPSNRRPIYYQTGFYEKGEIMEIERLAAARAISEYVGGVLGGAWIWCDVSFINGRVSPPWLADGPYYYYAFNWEAGEGICGNARLFLRI